MTVDRSKLNFYSGDPVDQIIGVHTGSISVGAPTSGQGSLSTIDTYTHSFGDSAYFQGIFTTDNGTTWNDFGAQTPYLGGTFPAFQTADCNATVDTTKANITGTSWYDFGNSRSVAYTFAYKIFLMAKNIMAQPITPLPVNEDIFLASKYNYQKIAFADTSALSVADNTAGGVPVSHNLGYFPKVRAWWFDAATPTICRPLTSARIQTRISTTDVTFFVDNTFGVGANTNGKIEYRIYYD